MTSSAEKDKAALKAQLEYAFNASNDFLESKRFYFHPTCPTAVAEIHDYSKKGLKALKNNKPTIASLNLREVILKADELYKAIKKTDAKILAVDGDESVEKMLAFAEKCHEDKLNLAPEINPKVDDDREVWPDHRETPFP